MNIDMRTVMMIKSCKDNNKLLKLLKDVYLSGYSDAQDAIIDDENRFLHISKDQEFQCECPECKAMIILDLEALLENQ